MRVFWCRQSRIRGRAELGMDFYAKICYSGIIGVLNEGE